MSTILDLFKDERWVLWFSVLEPVWRERQYLTYIMFFFFYLTNFCPPYIMNKSEFCSYQIDESNQLSTHKNENKWHIAAYCIHFKKIWQPVDTTALISPMHCIRNLHYRSKTLYCVFVAVSVLAYYTSVFCPDWTPFLKAHDSQRWWHVPVSVTWTDQKTKTQLFVILCSSTFSVWTFQMVPCPSNDVAASAIPRCCRQSLRLP